MTSRSGSEGPTPDPKDDARAEKRGAAEHPGRAGPKPQTFTFSAPMSKGFRALMERVQHLAVGDASAAATPPSSGASTSEPGRGSVGFEMQDTAPHAAERPRRDTGRPDAVAPTALPEIPFAEPSPDPVRFEAQPCILGRLSPLPELIFTPGEEIAEEFRLLMARVKQIAVSRRFRRIGIMSAADAEGKSTVALGLAVAMAQEQRSVLLVEADLRKPSLERTLQLTPGSALCDWLAGTSGIVRTRRLGPTGPEFLGAGDTSTFRPELLGSARMASLLAAAERDYDFVVVDTPPVNAVADSVLLQEILDGVVFVVRSRVSPREAILKALSYLKPDKVQGVVFNAPRDILPGADGYGQRRYARKG